MRCVAENQDPCLVWKLSRPWPEEKFGSPTSRKTSGTIASTRRRPPPTRLMRRRGAYKINSDDQKAKKKIEHDPHIQARMQAMKKEKIIRAQGHCDDRLGVGVDKLKPIKTIEPEGLNAFTDDGKWEEIELAVDSGATESVVTRSRQHQDRQAGEGSSTRLRMGSASRTKARRNSLQSQKRGGRKSL